MKKKHFRFSHAQMAVFVAAASLNACSQEAEFANGSRVQGAGSDALAGDMSGPGAGFDPSSTGYSDDFGDAWEPFSFTRYDQVVERKDVAVQIRPAFGEVEENLTMQVKPESRAEFRQLVRNNVVDSFTQGHDGAVRTETFAVSRAGLLDILVVVDNSTSMEEEQANLSQKLGALTSAIDDTNWQLGVINMSSPCLRLSRVIRRNDVDRDAAFREAASVGMNNNVVEKGYPMAIRALKGECLGSSNPWIRPGSTVAVLVVSDEDNCGSNNGSRSCAFDYGKNATEMVEFLRTIRPSDRAKLYGIHWIPNDRSCSTALGEAWKYQEGVAATGGIAGSICEADYSTTLRRISQDVRRSVSKEFSLAEAPDMRVLQVAVDGESLSAGYTISGHTLKLDQANDGRTTLVVTYSSGGVPRFDSVPLTKMPDEDTVQVTVNGVLLPESDWSFDPATKTLRFSSQPPERAAIQLRYKEKVTWKTSFSLGRTDIVPATVKVDVNGTGAADYSLSADGSTIQFPAPPAEGARISVSYRVRGDYTTSYPVSLSSPAKIDSVRASDVDTGENIPVAFAGDAVVFERDSVTPFRKVLVIFDYGEEDSQQTWELADYPEDGTFTMTADPPGACTSDVSVTGKTLSFKCNPGDRATLSISYRAITARRSTFDLSEELGREDSRVRLKKLQVTVDGKETKDFELARGRLVLGAGVVSTAHDAITITGEGLRKASSDD
ncbi:MAG: hypothetical protein RIQ81_2496 [Pseudomonadota bacterium]